jgi:hypothetical protein
MRAKNVIGMQDDLNELMEEVEVLRHLFEAKSNSTEEDSCMMFSCLSRKMQYVFDVVFDLSFKLDKDVYLEAQKSEPMRDSG